MTTVSISLGSDQQCCKDSKIIIELFEKRMRNFDCQHNDYIQLLNYIQSVILFQACYFIVYGICYDYCRNTVEIKLCMRVFSLFRIIITNLAMLTSFKLMYGVLGVKCNYCMVIYVNKITNFATHNTGTGIRQNKIKRNHRQTRTTSQHPRSTFDIVT